MKINIKKHGDSVTVALDGRLDTKTAPELEAKISDLKGANDVVLDLEKVDYVSSAGLRVILSMQKTVSGKGGMKVINVDSNVMDIFEVTGFSEILNIEQ